MATQTGLVPLDPREAERIVDSATPGYFGRWLRIDLNSGAGDLQRLAPETLRNYLGGSGLGAAILLNEGAAEAAVKALSPVVSCTF